MTTSFTNQQKINTYYTSFTQNTAEWSVMGQGTVSVLTDSVAETLSIVISNKDGAAIGLDIGHKNITLWSKADNQQRTVLDCSEDSKLLLSASNENLPYWLSLDSNNQRIRYGKGEMLHALMLYEYGLKDQAVLSIAKSLQHIQVTGATVEQLRILEIPINLDPAPHIVNSDAITLEILAGNTATVIADLPTACQKLYANVAGTGVNLCPEDFPEFAQAIQYSIITPGALCNKRLSEKDPIFGYLRVTIDPNLGDSPGQPYVLELWPAQNGSPIHDHGEACAVIKVLHGQIKISLFSTLSPEITQPWGSLIATKGDVTFLTPDYYQIHQLFNPTAAGGEFCATIQCYRYPDDNTQHYEYFDYIDGNSIQQFTPDSDWDYLTFKTLIKAEWESAKVTNPV